MSSTTHNIVIVGGGFAGLSAFNILSDKVDRSTTKLTLITGRPYFAHLIAYARLAVTAEGNLEDKVLLPYPDTLSTGNKNVVYSKVTSIVDDEVKGQYVTLDNGENIDYSMLVLAPGNIWEGPIGLSDKHEEAFEEVKSWRSRFEKAENIVLVGGGGVGIELSGEIKDEWPAKNVTIVHGPPLLLGDAYPDHFRTRVAQGLEKRGIRLILGDRIDVLEPKEGVVITRSGNTIPADLVVPTRGPRPNTKFIESLGPDALDEYGRIKVTPSLQLVGHPRIFAAGDVIDTKEQKRAGKAMKHAQIVVKNILTLLKNPTSSLTSYRGRFEGISLTNGKNGGTSYFGILWGLVFGDWLTRHFISKHLYVHIVKKRMRL